VGSCPRHRYRTRRRGRCSPRTPATTSRPQSRVVTVAVGTAPVFGSVAWIINENIQCFCSTNNNMCEWQNELSTSAVASVSNVDPGTSHFHSTGPGVRPASTALSRIINLRLFVVSCSVMALSTRINILSFGAPPNVVDILSGYRMNSAGYLVGLPTTQVRRIAFEQ